MEARKSSIGPKRTSIGGIYPEADNGQQIIFLLSTHTIRGFGSQHNIGHTLTYGVESLWLLSIEFFFGIYS